MKYRILLVTALMAVLFQGCIVKSLHPFFKEKDVIFKKELLHSWVDQDGNKWSITPHKDKPNAYEMHFLSRGEKDVVFLTHLFALEGEMYLDFLPLSDNREESLAIFELHLLPTHSIAKLDILNEDEIQIKWFNEDWLRSLFDQNRIKISHEAIMDETPKDEDDKYYILTAGTDELQKFVIKYGHDANAFENNNTVWLRLKRSI